MLHRQSQIAWKDWLNSIAFPLGQTSIASKVFETKDTIKNGADEINYVINLTKAKEHDYAYLKDEMQQIVTCCIEAKVICKVIFENCYLTDEEKSRYVRLPKKYSLISLRLLLALGLAVQH